MNEALILKSALQWSGVLHRKLLASPNFANELVQYAKQAVSSKQIDIWLLEIKNASPDNKLENCKKNLRLLRERVFYTLMLRDIQAVASLTEVVEAMSYLADTAMAEAYQATMAQLIDKHGAPTDPATGKVLDLLILAMGKWGGYELNVSSDIDFIALYEQEGETTGKRPLSYHEFYNRLVQQLSKTLSDITEHGQVFRCDLRLRPDGDVGPLAWSLAAVENYLITQGREWERYAWLKARPLNLVYEPDANKNIHNNKLKPKPHTAFERLRSPFVYRKYFDFDALAALRDLREQIREDWQQKAFARNATDTKLNIKLGDGGIREIEFVVQLNQLVRGGRQPSLQQENLLLAIEAQTQAGVLTLSVAKKLKAAYRFLRRTEHMLQYKDDAQTHLLPTTPEACTALAEAMGMSVEDFNTQLQKHRLFVSDSFKNAFRIAGLRDPSPKPTTNTTTLTDKSESPESNSFQDYAQTQFEQLLSSHRLRKLPSQSRKRLERLLPLMAIEASKCEAPEEALLRLLNVVESISQRSAYVALLAEYPETLTRLTTIVAASPWVAQYLVQYPLVLDSLIEWQSLMENPDFDAIKIQLQRELDACVLADGQADVEQQMNLMRNLQHQITFQLIAQDLSGLHSVEELADSLSALADLMLEETINRTWPLAQSKNSLSSSTNTPKFAVIAYGKLGGKELGYASDLDLVFLYDDPNNDAVEQYVRLGRRMISWLSTLTSSGRLYEVDMRLRPDGDAGLIAVSIDGFEEYQSRSAWSWEHQAITRARFVAGSIEIGARFEELRRRLLLRHRDPSQLRIDIRDMRERISAGHPNQSELFDLKHDQGGMVDIEFITQYLVLAHAHEYPVLLNNLGNIALLGLAAEFKLIDSSLTAKVIAAYRQYRKRQHQLRLQAQTWARVPPEQHADDRAAVRQLWEAVIGS